MKTDAIIQVGDISEQRTAYNSPRTPDGLPGLFMALTKWQEKRGFGEEMAGPGKVKQGGDSHNKNPGLMQGKSQKSPLGLRIFNQC